MAYIQTSRGKVYYESYGSSNQTLIILNGIMMSSASWKPFVEALSEKTRLILVDFYDQGKSDHLTDGYDQSVQIELVKEVIEALSLENITLMGISYGGEVAMRFAAQYPNHIKKLILANTTAYTDKQLKAIGDNWVHAAETLDGKKFFKATIPPIYSTNFYEANIDWLDAREVMFAELFKKPWYDAFARLVRSAENHDARNILSQISVPTLVIGADQDLITPIDRQEFISNQIENSKFVVIKSCGHASMYEKPIEFIMLVTGFIEYGDKNFII